MIDGDANKVITDDRLISIWIVIAIIDSKIVISDTKYAIIQGRIIVWESKRNQIIPCVYWHWKLIITKLCWVLLSKEIVSVKLENEEEALWLKPRRTVKDLFFTRTPIATDEKITFSFWAGVPK